ncbi:putative reverse transcriptase domain-containing protein [Tanacetum coccineum]
MEKDCRVRLQGAGNDFLQNVTCFGCGEKGHFKDKCPKAGNQQNDGARGRAYVVIENPQQNPNVVTGTFLLNDHYACILFDSGAEKSFVSSAFTPSINIAPPTLNTSYKEVFDVYHWNGLGWHTPSLIDCYEKLYVFLFEWQDFLKFKAMRPGNGSSFTCMYQGDVKKLMTYVVSEDFLRSSVPRTCGQTCRYPVDPRAMFEFLYKNWKTPESSTEIRSFLGLAGYYRRFIENFSKIAKPLTLLTQKNKAYVWGDKQRSFPNSEEKLCMEALMTAGVGPKKSYADKRRKPLEFQVRDRVLLKRVGPVAYRLKLPQELSCVHDTFHVSNLKKCLAEPDVQVPLDEIEIDENWRLWSKNYL